MATRTLNNLPAQVSGFIGRDAELADVLGVRQEPGRPVLETLVEALGGQRLLVVLDNCEHVVGACAKLADALLRECRLRLAASLRVYWLARGHAAEAADALQALLDAPAGQQPTLTRARALSVAANLIERAGGYATAEAYCEEALAIARSAGNDHLIAELSHQRAWVWLRQGRPDTALPLLEEGLSLARRLQDARLTAVLLSARSHALDYQGDHAGAAHDAAQALQFLPPDR